MTGERNPYEGGQAPIKIRKVRRAGFTEREFDTGTVRINYAVGPDNGPPLVLVPAQTGTWQSYQRVMPALSARFQVYAVDVRGHGRSTWTPGDYCWRSLGEDMRAFLRGVVGRPAIVAGNSSGGIIALWCAANAPELVSAIVLEDAPVFSAELPRFKEHDRYVYQGLEHAASVLGDLDRRDLADYLRGVTKPEPDGSERRVPEWFLNYLSRRISKFQHNHPGEPVDLRFMPLAARVMFMSLSMFDPDFARAFVDGRMYEGLDHAEALARVRCPLLLIHADWFRDPRRGLVGALDDQDAARIMELVPHARYLRVHANHVLHFFKPAQYVRALDEFKDTIESITAPS
ncbi:alpha/beta hydrolase [Nonomuraea turkmeniaca]|uniref:Alpha/beta hydrolase n=1 Tax=Nonomuraea turkmeniaca TaxID=103838 RepID=A0A5S4FMN0_9ACTN|nr:alpha/beta fold hydrolase [Nonomuraea turkmeniaca]TMR21859.1 alpha/beta hydrolase [Nonomuraea turkmeniaca]